jgi:WD40 repeat protein
VTGIQFWDRKTRKQLREIKPARPITGFAFSPDGKTLATVGQENLVRLWSVKDGKETGQIKGHKGTVRAVAFGPSNTLVTGGNDHTVRLWQVKEGKELRRLQGHRNAVFTVAMSADGKKVASCSVDGTTRIWDAATGKELRRWTGNASELVFSPDGATLTSVSPFSTAWMLDVASGRVLPSDLSTKSPYQGLGIGFGGGALGVFGALGVAGGQLGIGGGFIGFSGGGPALSADGRRLAQWHAVGFNPRTGQVRGGRIRLQELPTGKDLCPVEAHDGAVQALAWSSDGKLVTSGRRRWTDRPVGPRDR